MLFSKSFKTDIFKEIRFFCTAIILSVTQKRLQYLMQSSDYLMLNDVPKMNQGFPSCEDLHLHTLCVFQRTHICYSVLTVNSLMAGHEGVWCYISWEHWHTAPAWLGALSLYYSNNDVNGSGTGNRWCLITPGTRCYPSACHGILLITWPRVPSGLDSG